MKYIVMADLHFRVKNLSVIIDAFRNAMQYALDNNIKNIIIAGDIYHDRYAVPTDVRQEVEHLFYRYAELRKGVKFYICIGNHDMKSYSKRDVSSLSGLIRHENITVVSKYSIIEIEDKSFGFIPFNHNLEEFKKEFKDLALQNPNTIVTHMGVDQAKADGMPDMGLNTNFFKSCFGGMVVSGDYHRGLLLDKFLSPGCLTQQSFSDVEMDKGFWVFEDDEFTFHKSVYPEYIKLEVDSLKDVKDVQFEGNHIWIETFNKRIIKDLEKKCEGSLTHRISLKKEFVTSHAKTIEISTPSKMFEKCLDIRDVENPKIHTDLFHMICVEGKTYEDSLKSGFDIYSYEM